MLPFQRVSRAVAERLQRSFRAFGTCFSFSDLLSSERLPALRSQVDQPATRAGAHVCLVRLEDTRVTRTLAERLFLARLIVFLSHCWKMNTFLFALILDFAFSFFNT